MIFLVVSSSFIAAFGILHIISKTLVNISSFVLALLKTVLSDLSLQGKDSIVLLDAALVGRVDKSRLSLCGVIQMEVSDFSQ